MNKLIPTLVLFLITSSLYSTDYYTIASGNYTDAASVWSLDGITPCGCKPSCFTGGDNIYIDHDVTLDCNISITAGSNFSISSNGSLVGSAYEIKAIDGSFYTEGYTSLGKLTVSASSSFTVKNTQVDVVNVVTVYGYMLIDGGIFNVSAGNFTLRQSDGQLDLTNGAQVKTAGNFQTFDVVNLCATCCIESTGGNIFVGSNSNSIGEIFGSGGLFSSAGNLNNNNFVDMTINWCVAGNSSGMPMASNCVGTVAICTATPLASSALIFTAELVNNISVLNWKEVGEDLPSKYIVETSRNLDVWVEQETVYSNHETYQYAYNHPNSTNGMTYYRIVSVDSYSEKTYSDPIGLIGENEKTFIYPTVIPKDKIQFSIYSHERDESEISIIDYSGKVIYRERLVLERGENQLNVDKTIPASHYIITVLSGDRVTSHKAVIY